MKAIPTYSTVPGRGIEDSQHTLVYYVTIVTWHSIFFNIEHCKNPIEHRKF